MTSDKNNTPTKIWTPAVPAKRHDNIISSDYARVGRVFIPSYERECRPCMGQLMANEYQRIWWEERLAWERKYPDKNSRWYKCHPRPEEIRVSVEKSLKKKPLWTDTKATYRDNKAYNIRLQKKEEDARSALESESITSSSKKSVRS